MLRSLRIAILLLVMIASLGCVARGDATKPIPSAVVRAPREAARLVVVLPGRGDDLQRLIDSGIAAAVQSAWPDADVILAGLTPAYYEDGRASQRLHDEVIAPARRNGYREIWLAGASMGGMGTLMYADAYPGDVDGMVLLAPYVGDKPMMDEIYNAGGLARWNPGPRQPLNGATWQRELWRYLQTWGHESEQARDVWLAYGDTDRIAKAMPFLEPLLRPEQILVRSGGHTWKVWTPAMQEILTRARPADAGASGSR